MEKPTKINKKMSIREILQKKPEAALMMMNEGMHCCGCPMTQQETLEEGCLAHGINPDKLVKKINEPKKKK